MLTRAVFPASVLALAMVAAGCAGSAPHALHPGRLCARGGAVRGNVHVTSARDLARLSGCAAVAGNLVIDGAAVQNLVPLASLLRVGGSVRIGPTSALESTRGLSRLARVGGAVTIGTNLVMEGIFLPALRQVGGDLAIAHNPSLETAALERLRRVGGSVAIHANPDLGDLDLSSLARAGGRIAITGNAALEILLVPPHPRAAGRITIDVPRGSGGKHAPGDAGPRVPQK